MPHKSTMHNHLANQQSYLDTNQLGTVCIIYSLQGCFTAVPLAFIIPTACFLKLSKDKWCSVPKIVALLVMLLGIFVMTVGTVLAVLETVWSYLRHAEQYKPHYCADSDAYYNITCCRLLQATNNFSTSITLCDCTKFCPDAELFPILSGNYCNLTDPELYYDR